MACGRLICNAPASDSAEGHTCTRTLGHEGPHRACSNGDLWAEWSASPASHRVMSPYRKIQDSIDRNEGIVVTCPHCKAFQFRAERAEAALHEFSVQWHLSMALAKYDLTLEEIA